MHIVRKQGEWPAMPKFVPINEYNRYNFDGLTMRQLIDCFMVLKDQKEFTPKNEELIPLIDQDMDRIDLLIQKHKKAHDR